MKRWGCLAAAAAILAFGATMTPKERLARWKTVEMPFDRAALSAKEVQMVEKLVEACRLLDRVYWRQSDRAGLALYGSTSDPDLKRLLRIMGSRWDLIDENRPFVGSEPMPPGRDLYPHGPHAGADRAVRPASIPPTRRPSTTRTRS